MYRFLLFSIIVALIKADLPLVNHEICEGIESTGKDFTIQVSECTDHTNCPLYKGTTHTVVLNFTCSHNTSKSIYQQTYGVFGFAAIPYGMDSNVCEPGSKCATNGGLIVNQRYSHTSSFVVYSWFPTISLPVRFIIVDKDTDKYIVCLHVPVVISIRES